MELITKNLFGEEFHFSEIGIKLLFDITCIRKHKQFLVLSFNGIDNNYFVEGISIDELSKEINGQSDVAFELLLGIKNKYLYPNKYWEYIDTIKVYSLKELSEEDISWKDMDKRLEDF